MSHSADSRRLPRQRMPRRQQREPLHRSRLPRTARAAKRRGGQNRCVDRFAQLIERDEVSHLAARFRGAPRDARAARGAARLRWSAYAGRQCRPYRVDTNAMAVLTLSRIQPRNVNNAQNRETQMLRVPLQFGYREQPQKWPPAFLPRRARRRIMWLPQRGQLGVLAAVTRGALRAGLGECVGIDC